jgi:hypothetical protein
MHHRCLIAAVAVGAAAELACEVPVGTQIEGDQVLTAAHPNSVHQLVEPLSELLASPMRTVPGTRR